ncbi:ABC transporter ATP-binding protein [Intrasporangium calvum]|uniref:Oligopeptide/dipeptide ABC transporter, ATPase subunit n=1 Tax=Intrasporangium calvum (strain ATCC 23552 / DSM 43043 / JCM 3097 / NBRC 12989 / NCIMB 10167 / NRRL B-3866 / 7 KIP) TaxID=710696 RepID=E6SCR9_INTC7|nr:ABC transporter ATP-binding protein [Intrasporangium calvum]ADU47474.1 oligopeptide/dipeptide ABC transporter, ATPase subunit [Intrasporangium calvum DSM 43043]AXG12683.1 ABC transporter ATP-binding protein [Intrasporangium calvum]
MNGPIMRLDDVSVVHRIKGAGLFGHGSVQALNGASLEIRAGETVGVVGESGCGKSTMAKAMVGLQRPTSGSIIFEGRDIWSLKDRERRSHLGRGVGMIFQDPAASLNRRMPISQVVRDPLDVHDVGTPKERTARVRDLLDLVGLPRSAADVLPSQLSGGQRQRVSIARALALEPSLVIADEPTSALDVSVRAQILNLLLDLKERLGIAMVFVSHDIQTVKRVSDRVVTMYLGRIVEETPADRLPELAVHPYTRALFSATPGLLDPIDPIPLVGPVPSAANPPSGCPFRTRCWKATEVCSELMPGPMLAAEGHTYRCHHPVPAGITTADLAASARAATADLVKEPS